LKETGYNIRVDLMALRKEAETAHKNNLDSIDAKLSREGLYFSGSRLKKYKDETETAMKNLAIESGRALTEYKKSNFVELNQIYVLFNEFLSDFLIYQLNDFSDRIGRGEQSGKMPSAKFDEASLRSIVTTELNRLKGKIHPDTYWGRFIRSIKEIRADFFQLRLVRAFDFLLGAFGLWLLSLIVQYFRMS
jgi:hypothetical protein